MYQRYRTVSKFLRRNIQIEYVEDIVLDYYRPGALDIFHDIKSLYPKEDRCICKSFDRLKLSLKKIKKKAQFNYFQICIHDGVEHISFYKTTDTVGVKGRSVRLKVSDIDEELAALLIPILKKFPASIL